MVDTVGAAKALQSFILNNWFKGPSLFSFWTDQTEALRNGEQGDFPEDPGAGIVDSETADPQDVVLTRTQLVKNVKAFQNRAITQTAIAQLLAGRYPQETLRSDLGAFQNDMDTKGFDAMFRSMSASQHLNRGCTSMNRDRLGRLEAKLLSIPGLSKADLWWAVSPAAENSVSALFPSTQPVTLEQSRERGLAPATSINGTPGFQHMGVPGYLRRAWYAGGAIETYPRKGFSTLVAATGTMTVGGLSTGHALVVGQQMRVLDDDGDTVLAQGPLLTVGAASVTLAAASGVDGDQYSTANSGAQRLETDSAIAILFASSRCHVAFDFDIPQAYLVKRGGHAGFERQTYQQLGTMVQGTACFAVHFELVDLD